MMDKNNINAMSDDAILLYIGSFIKHHRLEQNKTQSLLAKEAGINRSTLVEFEKGMRANMLTFIQLLRVLHLLHLLDQFKIITQISPLQLAEIQQTQRRRASKAKKSKPKKSNW